MSRDQGAQKSTMSALKTKPFERNLALTKLGIGTGGRFVAHSMANAFRSAEGRKAADQTFYVERATDWPMPWASSRAA